MSLVSMILMVALNTAYAQSQPSKDDPELQLEDVGKSQANLEEFSNGTLVVGGITCKDNVLATTREFEKDSGAEGTTSPTLNPKNNKDVTR